MKDHHIVFSLLTFCGVKSDSVSGKMRLYLKTLKKMKVKGWNFTASERVYIEQCLSIKWQFNFDACF